MQILSLGVAEEPFFVYSSLKKQFDELENLKGLSIEQKQSGEITFYGIFLSDEEIKKNLDLHKYERIKYFIAAAICNVIVEYTQEKLIGKLIEENYYFLDNIEKEKILYESKKKVNEVIESNGFSNVKYEIIKKILDFLDSNFEFNFEGFLTFRLKEYLKIIENIIEDVANKYFFEREYIQFVNLLRYFVGIQNAKIDLVHVLPDEKAYILYDKEFKEIKDEFFEMLSKNLRLNLSKEDILLSRLISLSPRQVIFHKHGDVGFSQDILEMLSLLFEDRIHFCDECEIKNSKTVPKSEE
ncbi:putative sporulation protein YtxC [Caldicellulosiruptor naganoensis]|uniref:Sporulation protein YtxC n=1 Tax=Caldicellulosiruptor naganoensis TaxID=29324 RepID=A0ABY7BHT9_9FIRM|nr:putative sporulation protein YtxC [Caldicellulosiruptor naganoensis]WAM32403.1 putative sporulation protein YtxC [Caldicellulosiruptor naganoensis]